MSMRAWVLVYALLAAAGCKLVEPHSVGKSPLVPLAVSPETITLEVFSAPATRDDPQFAEIWKQVDEQPLGAELRRRLAANGMRAGVVGPEVPGVLAAALKVTGKRIDEQKRQQMSIDTEGGVTLRVVQAQSGKRVELAIGGVRDQFSLLESAEGQTRGKTYHKAECRMALLASNEADGRVRLDLTPELHYGEFKSHVRGNDGMMMWTQQREKRIFDELKLETNLAAGQMLLVTCRPEQSSTTGHHFFTDTSGARSQTMLWVFRVARAAPDRAFYDGPVEEPSGAVSNDQEE
jgi:hypothetical protein